MAYSSMGVETNKTAAPEDGTAALKIISLCVRFPPPA